MLFFVLTEILETTQVGLFLKTQKQNKLLFVETFFIQDEKGFLFCFKEYKGG